MRRSLATWVLVAAAAALMCLPSGCIGSRLGRKPSGEGWSRPSLLSWGKKKSHASATELAQHRPPASNVAPGTGSGSGLANNSSQSFPATNASSGYGQSGAPASYASTGANAYLASGGPQVPNGQSGNGSTSGQSSYVATSGGATPQRGFYPDEYQGGGQSGARSQYSEASAGGYNDTASGGYGGGYQDSYGSGAAQSRGYEEVADQRGSGYGDQYQGGDSRYVSPAGGQEQYDARNPAPAQYNDTYGSQYQGTSADSGYGNTSGGTQYSGGSSGAASQTGGAPVQLTGGARPFLPGSTKSYNGQPLNPPTSSGYSGQY